MNNVRIDLMKLNGAKIEGENIIIPISNNNITITETKAKLALVAVRRKNKTADTDTHYLQQLAPNSTKAKDHEEFPVIGHMTIMDNFQ